MADLLAAALGGASDSQLARGLIVLSRAADGREGAAGAIRAVLDERLPGLVRRLVTAPDDTLLAALRLAVASLRPMAGAFASLGALPRASPTLAPLAVDITALVVGAFRDDVEADRDRFLPDLAMALNLLSVRLGAVGRHEDALACAEESVGATHALAAADPDTFGEHLATRLNNLSIGLGAVGRPEDAVSVAQEAVAIRRELTVARLGRSQEHLATALNNLSVDLDALGRRDEALATVEEAVAIRRRLAEDAASPEALADLAMALNNLSGDLAAVGRREDALAASREAVDLRRDLVDQNPERFSPDLATSLNNLSNRLAELGRREDALAAIEEAVGVYRTLAGAHPEAFLPYLATALGNLSTALGDLGRREAALAAIEEAVAIRRKLAAARPDVFLPDLASSLNNLSGDQAALGRRGNALASAQEAVAAFRRLAAARPHTFRPRLAATLSNLSVRLGDLARREDALTAAQEAVAIRRELAAARPDVFLPDLASSLNNLSAHLAATGSPEDALAAIQEAVAMRRELADARPDAFRPDLAASLNNLSLHLAGLGRLGEALTPAENAVAVYRELAATQPDAFLPDLATSLDTLGTRLGDLGHRDGALAAAEEAIDLRRRLATDHADRFVPDLATSLKSLAVRLCDLQRRPEAIRVFAEILAEHAQDPWANGVLLLSRAQWHRQGGDLTLAITSARAAIRALARDTARRADARRLLRSMRAEDPLGFDRAWGEADLPIWLGHHRDDAALEERLVAWMSAPTWDESEAFALEHTDVLLTDPAESTFEHLIDANPGLPQFPGHLALLQAARSHGFEAAYAELRRSLHLHKLTELLERWVGTPTWEASRTLLEDHAIDLLCGDVEAILYTIADRRADPTVLFVHLGLLGICRLDGVEAGYTALEDPALLSPLPTQLPIEAGSRRALAFARLRAGATPDDAEAHLHHAVAALAAGEISEAERAIKRSAEASTSWDRQTRSRRLAALATIRPDLAGRLTALAREVGSGGSS